MIGPKTKGRLRSPDPLVPFVYSHMCIDFAMCRQCFKGVLLVYYLTVVKFFKVFDFSIFGDLFDKSLHQLDLVLTYYC